MDSEKKLLSSQKNPSKCIEKDFGYYTLSKRKHYELDDFIDSTERENMPIKRMKLEDSKFKLIYQ